MKMFVLKLFFCLLQFNQEIISECVYTKCQSYTKGCNVGYKEKHHIDCSCKKPSRKVLCCRESTTSNDTDRIVGGVAAGPAQFPYQISLRYIHSGAPDGHYCGGSILNENFVITASHCLYRKKGMNVYFQIDKDDLEVVAGDYQLLDLDSTEQHRNVEKIIAHANYTPGKHPYDIALLKLTTPLNLSREMGVDKIALPPLMHTPTGTGVVSGWGSTKDGYGPYPSGLRYANVTVISDGACRTAYGGAIIQDCMICAYTEGSDSCQGDSGGPMVCNDTGTPYLCGIVSFGKGCAEKGFPGVYTKLSHFIPWIADNAT